jgi:hypothetical protein
MYVGKHVWQLHAPELKVVQVYEVQEYTEQLYAPEQNPPVQAFQVPLAVPGVTPLDTLYP